MTSSTGSGRSVATDTGLRAAMLAVIGLVLALRVWNAKPKPKKAAS